MKSKIAITLLVGLPILALARPDLYKESEDFKFSRTSSDEGNKAGFYESQRGNMGGNFEKSYNMDNLAQRQLEDLNVRVGSNGQVSTNLNTGSTFGLASTSGTEYGAALNGHTASTGLNSNVDTSGQLQTGYGRSSGSNYNGRTSGSNYNDGSSGSHYSGRTTGSNFNEGASGSNYNRLSSQSSNLNRYSTYNRNAANGASLQSGTSQYDLNGASSNRDLEQGQHQVSVDQGSDYGRTNGQRYYYDAATGQYIQQNTRGQSSFGATSSQAVQGAQLSSLDRPLVVHPINVKVVPGTIVTFPVSAQAMNQHNSLQSQSQSSSNTNREYDATGYGDSHNYNDGQYARLQPTTRPKSYQSSYNYRKQWESHSAAPVVASVGPQVTIPVVVPTGTISSDSLQSNTRLNSGTGSVRYSSGSRVASAGQQHGATQYSNRNSYSGDNSQLELDTLASTNNNQASLNAANMNSLSTATADQQTNTGMDQVVSGSPDYTNTKPKNFQSSYSYHKAWERHGTPYVIKPAISADGTVDLNSNQGIDAVAQSSSHSQQSSHRSQSSTSSGANSRYQQGGNLCDINCYNAYLRDNQNNLGSENYRSKRSYNNYPYYNSQKYHPAGDSEENKDLSQQQLQPFNQEVDDGGQRTEDFGQQIDVDVGQQAEDFGQANIPVETNQGNLLYVGFNENPTPKYLINKPDIQYSVLFSKPSFHLNSGHESTTMKNDYNLMNTQRYNHHLWSQQTELQNQFMQKQNEDMNNHFLEIDKIAKEFEASLKLTPDHSPKLHHVNIGLTQHPTFYHYPYQGLSHHTANDGEFGHDRHIQDKHLFLHRHSQLHTDCKKHETSPTTSINVDDVLKRIDELQKQLGFGSFNLNKPVTPIQNSSSKPTPKVSHTTIPNTYSVKTPEEIEALSLTRNPDKPFAPSNNNQTPQVNFNSINSGKQKHDFDQQEENVDQDFEQKVEDIGQETEDFGQKVEDIGQETQDFGQKVEDIGPETQDFRQKVEDIGQKVEDIGQKVEDIGQEPQEFGQKVEDIGQETQKYWTQKEDVGQETQDFGQQQEHVDQIQVVENNDLGLHLGIVRQQLHAPKDLRQQDENKHFIHHEQLTENKEISNFKPDSQRPAIILNYNSQVKLNKQDKEIIQVQKNSEENPQDLGQETMDFGQSQIDFGQSQMFFGQSQNKPNVQVPIEETKDESQELGQETMDFGQSQMDFGQSQMDFGQSQMDLGQSQIDIGQTQMDFGQSHNLIGTGENEILLSQSQNKVNVQVQKEEPEEESQEVGQESMDFGQNTMDFGQSQIDIGQSQLDFGQAQLDIRTQIDLDQSQIDLGKSQVNIGPSEVGFDQAQVDIGQSPTDFGQSQIDIGQSQLGFDQSQVNFGQSQTQVDKEQATDDFVQAQLNLGQQVEGFDQSVSGGLHLKYGNNEPKHQQGMPLHETIGKQSKEVTDVEKYKNLEIDESAAPKVEVVTIKPGFFKNLGNKISTGFNNVFG